MKWYLNIKGEKIIGAYGEKLLDDLIEYEADENFDRTQHKYSKHKYSNGQVLKISEQERMTLYSEELAIEQERTLADMMTASARASFLIELPDSDAVKIPLCYDAWETDKAYKVGDRVECDGKLWKCRQAHTSQENWKPSIETASLWEVIDVEHAGTLEDPIPYDQTMTVYNGKYYLEDGIIYKCVRDSGQPLYATCASLVGNNFEVAQ